VVAWGGVGLAEVALVVGVTAAAARVEAAREGTAAAVTEGTAVVTVGHVERTAWRRARAQTHC